MHARDDLLPPRKPPLQVPDSQPLCPRWIRASDEGGSRRLLDPTRRKGRTPRRHPHHPPAHIDRRNRVRGGDQYLPWIVEDGFRLDATAYHELAFAYAIFPTDPTIPNKTWTYQTTAEDVQIELRRFDLDELEPVNFQPSFLKILIQAPPKTPQHMIVREPH